MQILLRGGKCRRETGNETGADPVDLLTEPAAP